MAGHGGGGCDVTARVMTGEKPQALVQVPVRTHTPIDFLNRWLAGGVYAAPTPEKTHEWLWRRCLFLAIICALKSRGSGGQAMLWPPQDLLYIALERSVNKLTGAVGWGLFCSRCFCKSFHLGGGEEGKGSHSFIYPPPSCFSCL